MGVKIRRRAERNKRLTPTRWVQLRDAFIELHLSGQRITVEEFAAREGVPVRTMQYRCSKWKWFAEIEKRAERQQHAIAEHSAKVVADVRRRINFDEVEVRERHSKSLHMLLSLANRKLGKLVKDAQENPGAEIPLSIQQMIDIFKFAPAEERKALGLPDTIVEIDIGTIAVSKAQEKFEKALRNTQKARDALLDMAGVVEGIVVSKSVEKADAGA